MFDKRGVVPRRRYDDPMDWLKLLLALLIVGCSVGLAYMAMTKPTINSRLKTPEETQQKSDVKRECVDYTLREYREGDAPQKCQAEVYGDQF